MNDIEKRKDEHIDISLKDEIQYKISPGFENVQPVYNAMPEMNINDVDSSLTLFGKKMYSPIIIEAMTGGFKRGQDINLKLAETAQRFGVAMGLGSQRAMLESGVVDTYYVRDVAPNILLFGNIGIVQLIDLVKQGNIEKIDNLVQKPEIDVLAVHVNPLQEIIQPEGDNDFSGGYQAIMEMVDRLKGYNVPVIVKEVGSGISGDVAEKLKGCGVAMVDVAGAGGTSWSKIEYARGKGKIQGFEEFGIPTVASILMCKQHLPVIASGGVRSGIDVFKSLLLGAEVAGAAQPFLKALVSDKLDETIKKWNEQIKTSMFLAGAKNLEQLKTKRFVLTGEMKQWANQI